MVISDAPPFFDVLLKTKALEITLMLMEKDQVRAELINEDSGLRARLDKDNNEQYRQKDEVLSLPGGTSTQNIAAWRSDGLTWNWKYLTVREVTIPTT